MPKMSCTCGNVLRYSDIPCAIQYDFISDIDYDNYQGKVDAEDLFMAMRHFFECPQCRRLWVYWNGFKEAPTEYVRVDQKEV